MKIENIRRQRLTKSIIAFHNEFFEAPVALDGWRTSEGHVWTLHGLAIFKGFLPPKREDRCTYVWLDSCGERISFKIAKYALTQPAAVRMIRKAVDEVIGENENE